mmetsp:Transcript_40457/g.97646  ORF Transcript_40457/g.97646 Transcript_40457/m.97646 type:complete len:108 (+) Transcript_40457:3229-3552(+)
MISNLANGRIFREVMRKEKKKHRPNPKNEKQSFAMIRGYCIWCPQTSITRKVISGSANGRTILEKKAFLDNCYKRHRLTPKKEKKEKEEGGAIHSPNRSVAIRSCCC